MVRNKRGREKSEFEAEAVYGADEGEYYKVQNDVEVTRVGKRSVTNVDIVVDAGVKGWSGSH